MMTVKIECECGQHYAFDVEPISGKMPSAIACPACGADGTPAANEIISRQIPASEVVHIVPPPSPKPSTPLEPTPAAAASSLHLKSALSDHTAPSVTAVDSRTLGMVNREQAEHEARAKMSWGDSPDSVTKYLMLQGFSVPDARAIVARLYQERLAALRIKGIRKMVTGFGMMCVPLIFWIVCVHIGMILLKPMGIAIAIGLWGVWILLNGIITLIAPRMESGDVAEG